MYKEKLLMTPGPTMLPPEVLEVMSRQIVHHRSKEFGKVFAELNENLKFVFQTQNPVLTMACSGTGGMESAVANLFNMGDKVLIASMGVFGDRFIKIAESYGLEVVKANIIWGNPADPAEIKSILDHNPDIKAVFVTHNETSTGVMNNIEEIGKITKNTDKLFIVDAISSVGGLEIRTDDWGIDVVIGSSQKALMAPPGLAFIALSDKAWKAQKNSKLPKFYFNYIHYKNALELDSPDTPFTPAITAISGQNVSLNLMKEIGLEKIYKKHAVMAKAVQEGIKSLGLKLFAREDCASNIITSALTPENVDIEKVRKIMNQKYNIMVTGGQSHLSGKIIRFGHCGYVDGFDLIKLFTAFEYALIEVGYPLKLGTSISVVSNLLDNSVF